jgi:putative transposase
MKRVLDGWGGLPRGGWMQMLPGILGGGPGLHYGPFWCPLLAEHSKTLWQPTNLNLVPLPKHCGWHHMTGDQRLSPLLAEVHADYSRPIVQPQQKKRKGVMEGPQLPTTTALGVVKHHLIISAEQRADLKRWDGGARRVYNAVVAWIRDGKPMNKAGQQQIYDECVRNDAYPDGHWMRDIPYDIRAGACRDAIDAWTTNMKKKEANPRFKFQMQFRVKRSTQSIYICSRAVKLPRPEKKIETKKGTKTIKKARLWPRLYPKFLKGDVKTNPPLPAEIKHDCRLVRTELGQYFLCVPMDLPITKNVNADENQVRVIALDPGVRVFQTGYDPQGKLFEFGRGDARIIERLCLHLDALQSKLADKALRARRRYRLKKASARLRMRIRNLVDDAHRKTAHFLVTNYDLVLLPEFKTKNMANKLTRNITSKVARSMLTWAHYRFRQHLIQRGKRTGTEIKIVSEAYTSKTCGACGAQHNVKKDEVFICPHCPNRIGRDANAARNILLRNVYEINLDLRSLPPRATR